MGLLWLGRALVLDRVQVGEGEEHRRVGRSLLRREGCRDQGLGKGMEVEGERRRMNGLSKGGGEEMSPCTSYH